MTKEGREQVYLSGRFGFLRLALKEGVPVIPVYIFGTSDMWYSFDFFYSLRKWIVKKLRIALPLFTGRYGLPLFPRRAKLTGRCPFSFGCNCLSE